MARSSYGKFLLFIAFVCGAAVLWFLSRYNNTFEEYTTITVEWTNIPVDIELDDSSKIIEVPVKIKAIGFQLLWLNYRDIQTSLDFEKYVTDNNKSLVFEPESARILIDRSIGSSVDVIEVDSKPIILKFQRFASKKVALVKDFKLTFEGNYKESGESGFNVQEVKITGNDERIKNLNELRVKQDDIRVNDTLIIQNIDLRKIYPDIKMDPSTITYTIRAAQMTEGSFRLPIVIKNVPNNVTVKLIPDVVNVVYTCKLLDYNDISKNDFEVVIDINEIGNSKTNAVPILTYTNDKVKEARVQPQSVQILTIQ